MRKFKDGWHKIHGLPAYFEDGFIRRFIYKGKIAYIYRKDRCGYWTYVPKITLYAYYAGRARGTIKII